jgi:hypothetical protein
MLRGEQAGRDGNAWLKYSGLEQRPNQLFPIQTKNSKNHYNGAGKQASLKNSPIKRGVHLPKREIRSGGVPMAGSDDAHSPGSQCRDEVMSRKEVVESIAPLTNRPNKTGEATTTAS